MRSFGHPAEPEVPKLRLALFRTVVILSFAVLAVQLWRLQIVQGREYRLSADRNRFRLVNIEAPRGVIYDRHGQILVRNHPSFTVSIVPADLPPEREMTVFTRLSELLGVPVSNPAQSPPTDMANAPPRGVYGEQLGIKERVEQGRAAPFSPVPIKTGVRREIAFIIEEEHLDLPGVVVQIEPIRGYVEGPLTAKVIGYVGHIPRERVDVYLEQGYDPNDKVGLTGVEFTYEKELRGTKGRKHIEVDVAGREVRTIGPVIEAVPGHNLILTLDVELQRVAEAALQEQMSEVGSSSGVVIAINPQTGEVLAMVSLPSFDNNLFSAGISVSDYQRLISDPERPLFNHAIGGEYPTGSTFKIVPAAAALQEGVVDKTTKIFDPGVIWLPNRYAPEDPDLAQPFYCWYKKGHGFVNVVEAIAHSCDVFFYEIAGGFKGSALFGQDQLAEVRGLGQKRLGEYARFFGFGQPTGIDLPGEGAGLVADDQWKRQNQGARWVTGDTYNLAIGQGLFSATPLQLLNATAAVANGGTLYRPQVLFEVRTVDGDLVRPFQPQVIRQIPVSAANLALVREGMLGAVEWGTARRVKLEGVAVAGKTGTAEYCLVDETDNCWRDEEGNLPVHAWFTAFAPYEHPEIALVVFIEGGGEGSQVAAPVAAKILRYYFGLPEPQPTPTPTTPQT